MNIQEKEEIEINFWRDSQTENPIEFSIDNIVNKMGFCSVFLKILTQHSEIFENAKVILELGGGQGWASCIVKKMYNKEVYASDISQYAIDSLKYWEDLFKVRIDKSFACRSYDIPLADESVDLIFCFAAAHHFVEQEKSLVEIKRVLKKGGCCIYMYEPSCNSFFYPMAYKRVNKKRPEVPEDLLLYKKIKSFGESIGLRIKPEFYASSENRGPIETIYYFLLQKFSFLQKILPCTMNYIINKD